MKGHPLADEAVGTGFEAGDDGCGEAGGAADAIPAGIVAEPATGTGDGVFAHPATRNTMSTSRAAEGTITRPPVAETRSSTTCYDASAS